MSEPVWIDKDLGKVTPTDEQIQTAANAYLEQAITNPDSPPLDRSLTSSVSAAPADVTGDLKSAFNDLLPELYTHNTDTDIYYWRANTRVNSTGTNYATSQTHYTGMYKNSNYGTVYVYPGSTFYANTGYTLDYSVVQNGTKKQFERGVAAGTVVTVNYEGVLRISVTDGTSDTSTAAKAKAVAKAGLTIDLLVAPLQDTVLQNKADIAEIKPEVVKAIGSLEVEIPFVGYVNDYDIVTNVSVGDTVDINSPKSAGTMCYGIIPCEQGDKFSVTGKGLNNPRTWAFTDTEYKLISKSGDTEQATNKILIAESDGYLIVNAIQANPHSVYKKEFSTTVADDVAQLKKDAEQSQDNENLTKLVSAQKAIAEDWHFAFIDVANGMGLGSNHLIPGTKTIWSQSGTKDLVQKDIWMSDGTHPFKGSGVTDMYARTIAPQLAMVVPSYRDGVGETSPSVWAGRRILWMGTSIPAGSDPDAGEGTGATYPALVSTLLGSTSINKAKGSSCVRINASTGTYNGMIFNHFVRALSRTVAECDVIASEWDDIKEMISGAPDTLSESNITTMKNHSFENLLLPYLDGTYTMPDLFVIDHGHNDVRPKGINGKNDLWLTPTAQMITDGILAEDTYMTDNSYANLKLAFNDDLSGISNKANFAATVNRNCFKGAVNFIITLILRYNPYARIVIVSDYN